MKLPKHKKALILHATIIKYTLRLSKYFHRKLRKNTIGEFYKKKKKTCQLKNWWFYSLCVEVTFFWREMSVVMRWRTKLASVFRRKNSNSNFFHHHSAVYRILNRIYSKVRNMKISWIFDIFRHSCECENEKYNYNYLFCSKNSN